MENYLKQHNLPNEWDYFRIPAKPTRSANADFMRTGVRRLWGLASRFWGVAMGEPFENSEAWKSARVLTNEVYSLCRHEPLPRDFGLRDQLQRAAVFIDECGYVAEGWESLHVAEKRQAYNIARESCGEVRSMTYVLLDNEPISVTEQTNLQRFCIQSDKLIRDSIRAH